MSKLAAHGIGIVIGFTICLGLTLFAGAPTLTVAERDGALKALRSYERDRAVARGVARYVFDEHTGEVRFEYGCRHKDIGPSACAVNDPAPDVDDEATPR